MRKINYYLRKNPLTTSDENLYMARIQKKETLRQDDIINLMLGKNTTVTRQDIIVVLDLLKETVKEQILSGFPIIMDLFKARIGVKGGFTSVSDEFDEERHLVNLNMNATSEFKKDLAYSASMEKVRKLVKAAVIEQIYDYESRAYGLDFPAGGLIGLYGDCLKPVEGDPQVFLRRDGTEDWVPAAKIHGVSERSILCSLPDGLEAGGYWIRVVIGDGDEAVPVMYDNMVNIS